MPEELKRKRLEIRNQAIKNWLAERNQLIISYCKLTGKRSQNHLPEPAQVDQFCDLLIDYVSAGHFEVYQQIVRECDKNGHDSLKLLEDIYPQISHTTDIVVDFNEKYAKNDNNWAELDPDLSRIGEAIAKRVDLEDSLIDTLRHYH